MKKIILIILLYYISIPFLFSQGFDWQYSIRFPSKSPNIFIGASASKQNSTGSSNFSFTEASIPCCEFRKPSSNAFTIGINSEYWFQNGLNAISFNINYRNSSYKLKAQPDPVIYKNDTLITEIINNKSINYIDFSAFYKYRIKHTHLFLGTGLQLNLLISSKDEFSEHVISDNSFNNGEKSRNILQTSTAELMPIVINPAIRLGYDFSLMNSLYCSVYTDFAVNINSIVKQSTWRNYQYSIAFIIYYGIF